MFIPIGDDNSQRRITPYITWILIAANAAVWWLQNTLGEGFTAGYSAIPFEITNSTDLVRTTYISIQGEKLGIPHAPGPTPIYLTLVTSMFMHGSWGHIMGNMLYLVIFGDQIEDRLGRFKYLLFYLVSGLGAAAAQIFVDPSSVIPCVGASGAIAGVLGSYLILYPTNKVKVMVLRSLTYLPASIVLGAWGAMQIFGQMNVMVGQSGGVAYMAHIGGFIVGLVVSVLVKIGYRGDLNKLNASQF